MTKLAPLRYRLSRLRRARHTVRWGAAVAALAVAVLWALAGVFALDYLFELSVLQRVVVLAMAVAAVVWAALKYTAPWLGIHETDQEMALLVEQQQQIDSDLIGALQFESPGAAAWGSPQLEAAVVDYVAEFSPKIDVFAGFSREQLVRRATILGVTAAVLIAACLAFPRHAAVFLQRLALSSRHYPTATVIDQLAVNGRVVLIADEHGSAPLAARAAQGKTLEFIVQTTGVAPTAGRCDLIGDAGGRRSIDLAPLSLAARQARLREGAERVRAGLESNQAGLDPLAAEQIVELVRYDAPRAARTLASEPTRAGWRQAAETLEQTLAAWPGEAASRGLFVGQLPRLVDPVSYKLYLNDAWTDPARVEMIPLPVIELQLAATPPAYAQGSAAAQAGGQGVSRQLSVLEGSEVDVAIECVNGKPLTTAWLIARHGEDAERFPLVRTDDAGLRWRLDSPATPFRPVLEEVRFEVQVVDRDGLGLETPLKGFIRLKADRPPSGAAEVVHRVVLPEATPVISYRVSDDYGVGQLLLHVQIERRRPNRAPTFTSVDEEESTETEQQTLTIHAAERPPLVGPWPQAGTYKLALAPYDLQKGDHVQLTLEVIDYRGPRPGQSYRADPLALEISDESGVLAAISEADERSEQRLTDIIKRQLGIGETP